MVLFFVVDIIVLREKAAPSTQRDELNSCFPLLPFPSYMYTNAGESEEVCQVDPFRFPSRNLKTPQREITHAEVFAVSVDYFHL